MDHQNNFKSLLAEMEEEFRAFRKSRIDKYESDLERAKANWKIQDKEREKLSQERRASLSEIGIDTKKLDAKEKAEDKRLEKFLQKVRPQFVDREPEFDVRLREQALRAAFFSRFGWSQAHLLGADRLTKDIASLDGVEGEVSNPAVWLYDAEKLTLSEKRVGKGSGCAHPGLYFDETLDWYYTWIPPKSGHYAILAGQDYHGFYILEANKGLFDCKRASVSAYAKLHLYQYFGRGTKKQVVIDKEGQNISESGFLYGSSVWSFTEYLGGGDQVSILISFDVCAEARGSGSYAEINFAEGKANYVNAPYVFFIEIEK